MPKSSKKGIIFFIVIGIIMVVVILSTVILRIVANHSRQVHHQVSRIQAQYAAKAGLLYALDKLRRNDDASCWAASGEYTRTMFQSGGSGCDFNEPNLPSSVSRVDITVYGLGSGLSGTRRVSSKAIFTYTPS